MGYEGKLAETVLRLILARSILIPMKCIHCIDCNTWMRSIQIPVLPYSGDAGLRPRIPFLSTRPYQHVLPYPWKPTPFPFHLSSNYSHLNYNSATTTLTEMTQFDYYPFFSIIPLIHSHHNTVPVDPRHGRVAPITRLRLPRVIPDAA